jgi:phosphatidylglycerol lysyltransferase
LHRFYDVSANHERLREIILRYGWNSTCYQLLNPGFAYWFSAEHDAVAGFVDYAGYRIVAGSPIAAFDALADVVKEFECDASREKRRVCYFASEARLESIIGAQQGYSVIRLGAQPVWHPKVMATIFEDHASLRAQVSRARNKGVVIEEWPAERATNNAELHALLRRWLASRGLPSMHFLIEPETLSSQRDRRIFVAVQKNKVVGFLNLSPVPTRNGWLAEQFVRDDNAPNGTVELMLADAVQALANDGAEYFTLGLSPLTEHSGPLHLHESAPPIIRFLLAWVRAHGKRFYNFEGLEFFKTKFDPEEWEPIYAIANEPHFTFRALYAIGCAFTNGHPIRTVLGGIAKAIDSEFKRLKKRLGVA